MPTETRRRGLAELEPRRVRSMSVRNAAAVGGVRRAGEGPQRIEIFSLCDGTRRTFAPPGGLVLDVPFYASEREIMFPGRGAIRFDPTLLPTDR